MANSGTTSLSTVELFCKAAEKLSFTAAASSLGTTPSAVSKAVSRLEKNLGISLFQRSTRTIRLTEEGNAYYLTCRQALDQIRQGEDALRNGKSGSLGTLRVSLPNSYAIKRVIPLLPRFLERHHGRLKLVVDLSNSVTDFVADGFDLAIRIGKVADSRLIARRLHTAQSVVVASPGYLKKFGAPQRPQDLYMHQCIDQVLPDTGKPMAWQFTEDGERRNAKLSSRLLFNHPIAVLTAATNGCGLARLLDFTVEAELKNGTLVEVLANYRASGEDVSAVYLGNRNPPAKIRTFLDFLVDELASSGLEQGPNV